MYSLLCFKNDGSRFQQTAPTSDSAFSEAINEGAIRVIDLQGSVFVLENGKWNFFGVSTWTQVAGSRAGSQNFSLINPPK